MVINKSHCMHNIVYLLYPHTVTKLFPDAIEIKEEPEDDYDSISEVQMAVSESNDSNLPYDLQFFPAVKK